MVAGVPERSAVPTALLEYDQWLCWRVEQRDGKATKLPVDPGDGSFASTTDPEMWGSFETARFFTVTAEHVDDTPTVIHERPSELEAVYREYISEADTDSDAAERASTGSSARLGDDELVEKAMNASNAEKFERLWRGGTSGYESHSEADMALCSMLAFWTGGTRRRWIGCSAIRG